MPISDEDSGFLSARFLIILAALTLTAGPARADDVGDKALSDAARKAVKQGVKEKKGSDGGKRDAGGNGTLKKLPKDGGLKKDPAPAFPKGKPADEKGALDEKAGVEKSLGIKDGRVTYEGRDVDSSLREFDRSLRESLSERERVLAAGGNPDRLKQLDKQIAGLQYSINKYSELRARALSEAGLPDPNARTQTPDLSQSRLQRSDMGRAIGGAASGGSLFGTSGREAAGGLPEGPSSRPTGDAQRKPPESDSSGPSSSGDAGPAASPTQGDPSEPLTQGDLVLASMSGFSGAFDRMGLRAGSDAGGLPVVLRRDGAPASAAELELLRAEVRGEPKALMRRPDFHSVLPRERHAALKRAFTGLPAARGAEFKDIGLTRGDRDFAWSKSCVKVSGDCNSNSGQASYKKDDFVPPEDLDQIWSKLMESADDLDADWEWEDPDVKTAREKLSRRALGEAGGKRGFLDTLKRWLGSADTAASAGPAASSEPARRDAGGGRPGEDGPSAGGAPFAGAALSRAERDSGPAGGAVPVPDAGGRNYARAGRWSFWIVLLAVSGALISLGLRRRARGARF